MLDAKATQAALTSGLASKQDNIVDGGLSQSKVTGLVADIAARTTATYVADAMNVKADAVDTTIALAGKASLGALTFINDTLELDISTKQPTIGVGGLAIYHISCLQLILDQKTTAKYVADALTLKKELTTSSSAINASAVTVAGSLRAGGATPSDASSSAFADVGRANLLASSIWPPTNGTLTLDASSGQAMSIATDKSITFSSDLITP